MRQALHIFGKDSRRCWPYIAGVSVLSAVNCRQIFLELGFERIPDLGHALANLLLVLSWWLAIGAAIHGESPVGDRQFWLTRPYSWKSLLAAKLLFLAVYLGLPLLASDSVLLLANGFNPLALVPGLLVRYAWLLAFLALPFTAAALTRRTRDIVLAGLLCYVAWYFGLILAGPLVGSAFRATPSWAGFAHAAQWFFPPAAFCLVGWQYRRRGGARIRTFAIGLGGLAIASSVFSFATDLSNAIARPRGDVSRFRDVEVSFAPNPARSEPAQSNGFVGVPVRLSGWPHDLVDLELSGATAIAMRIPRWSSGQFAAYSIAPGQDGRDTIMFAMDESALKQLPAEVDLVLSIELKIYERYPSARLRPDSEWARIPGFGNVRLMYDRNGQLRLTWAAAPTPPDSAWAYSLRVGDSPAVRNRGWGVPDVNVVMQSPLVFSLSPVCLYWAAETAAPNGLELVFTPKRLVAKVHRDLKLSRVRLMDLVATYP